MFAWLRRRKPKSLPNPPYKPPVRTEHAPAKDPDYVVKEELMSTGMFKVFGRTKPKE